MRPAVAALVLLLAGCADGGAGADGGEEYEELADLKATKDTGVIRGLVVDATVTPVVGAQVVLESTGQNTTTSQNGLFGFQGVEPGFHFLTISKPGFVTMQAQEEVVAGVDDPDILKVQLVADPASRPDFEELYVQGYIACSFTLALVSFAACGLTGVAELTNNHFIDIVTYARVADFVQSEMVWRSTQTLGDSMSLSWTDASSGAQVRINASAGPSPVVVTFGRAEFEQMNLTDKDLWMRVFSTAREGTDVVPEQAVHDQWASAAYPVYNGTVPTAVKDTVADAVTQCVPFVGCTLNPLGEDCIRWVVLFNACMGVGGFGATIEQEYEIFNTSFYGYRPPPGWMFTEQGAYHPPE